MQEIRFWQRNLAARLVFYFLVLFLVTVALLGTVAYFGAAKALETAVFGRLEVEADLKAEALAQWVQEEEREFRLFAELPLLRDRLDPLVELDPETTEFQDIYEEVDLLTQRLVDRKSEWHELLVLSSQGKVLLSTEKAHENDYRTLDTYFVEGLRGTHTGKVYASVPSYTPTLTLSLPIGESASAGPESGGKAAGVLALHLDLRRLDEILENTGLGEGGESFLVDSVNVLVSGRRFGSDEFLRGVHSEGISEAVAGRDGSSVYTSHRGALVLGAYRHIDALGAALLVEIPLTTTSAPARRILAVIIGVGLAAALLLTAATFLLARQITGPVLAVRDAAVKVAEGDLLARAPVTTRDEVGTLARSFNEMAEHTGSLIQRLKQVDKLKDDFLANTSHELRTPLYGITGLAESLISGAAGKISEPMRINLSMIVASSRRLGHLVNDILDFSKLRHQSLELHRRPMDLHSIAEVVLTLSRPLVSAKALELHNAVPEDLPAADVDEDRLQQILHNLVGNAIKFTEAGKVVVAASVGDGRLVVRVTDTGIGIGKEHQEKIFGAFEQADASVEREYGGTGLGLAVTSELVELHGGRLSVESELGRGSTFSFDLPMADTTAERPVLASPLARMASPGRPRAANAETPRANAKAPAARLLAVDDEPVNLQVLHNFLSLESFEITLAGSGPEALEYLEKETFDLVLLDVMMPRMSGYEVCKIIRQTHPVEKLPVLFLSALDRPDDRIAGLEHGGNDYLSKPVSQGELLSRVRTHLELLRAHRVQEEELQNLQGLLPICMHCKKIRDDDGKWNPMEVYITQRSEAEFSHGVCPTCTEALYRESEAWD